MKTDGSHMLPHHGLPGQAQPSPVQRAVMNRQGQLRRSGSTSTAKPLRPHAITSNPPPRLQPTPPSQRMSPATSTSSPHAGKAIPRSLSGDPKPPKPRQPQIDPRQQPHPGSSKINMAGKMPGMQNNSPTAGKRPGDEGNHNNAGSFYTPPYQAHIEQLGKSPFAWIKFVHMERESPEADAVLVEQEYDAQADMLDDENPSDTSLGGPYQPYPQHPMNAGQQMSMGMQGQPPMHAMSGMQSMGQGQVSQQLDPNSTAYGVMNSGFDPYDPSLDADPFGLSASMHFPTQFTYQENSMRR